MPRSVRAIEPREAVGRCKGPSRGEEPGGIGPARGSSVPISTRNINNVRVRITLVLGLGLNGTPSLKLAHQAAKLLRGGGAVDVPHPAVQLVGLAAAVANLQEPVQETEHH